MDYPGSQRRQISFSTLHEKQFHPTPLNNNNTKANTRFTSNEFKLKARRSIPTYTLTCNKHITDTQQGQQYTVHTRGVKAGRSLLGNGKEIDCCIFIFKLNWLHPAS